MAQDQEQQPASGGLPDRYSMRGDVEFQGLSLDPDTGKYQLLFFQEGGKWLDVLLSAEALNELTRALLDLSGGTRAEFQNQVHVGQRRPPLREE